eukprot:126128_1
MSFPTKDYKFWAYNSFKQQLTVNVFIKKQFRSQYHPPDIISLIFKYYHTFIFELQYFNYYTPLSIDTNPVIEIEKNVDIWLRPSTVSQWAMRAKSPINNHPLQYKFSINCIENISNNNVFIGIAPFNSLQYGNNLYYYRDVNGHFKCDVTSQMDIYNQTTGQSAYFIQNELNCYTFFEQNNWWKRIKYSSMKCITRISETIPFSSNDIISLILDCQHWKLSFLINNTLIHSINVAQNVIYSPVILFKNCSKSAKCKIISMKCAEIN